MSVKIATENLRIRIRITIGAKLISLIGILLLASVAGIVGIATHLFVEDNTALIQQMNADTASSLVTRTRAYLSNLSEMGRIAATGLIDEKSAGSRVLTEIFEKDGAFLASIIIKPADPAYTAKVSASPEFEARTGTQPDTVLKAALTTGGLDARITAETGVPQVSAVATDSGRPVLVFTVPFIESPTVPKTFTHVIVVVADGAALGESFGASPLFTSYLVDSRGRLLVHPDPARVLAGENVAHLGIVEQMLSGKFSNGQTRYMDPASHEFRLGAFRLVGFGGLGVVTDVPEGKAKEAAQRVKYRSILAAVIVLCMAFFFGYVYSGTITTPIRALMDASKRIAKGDFSIALKPKSHDELGHLSVAFNEMAQGLEERDRVKETFNKFHNKEIADKLLSGEVKLGGERLSATIFFSDVRGFTSLSEKMEPEGVVEMINEYMTRMVRIIREHGGIVDKYVGDAIMALWGVPI
ncbi:MAG TPA: HAMP domain-containing protein, partial [Bdellovibrionota bacterium]|nr:HAMP domain-containing protein [Bdellovibrionota bacterium]